MKIGNVMLHINRPKYHKNNRLKYHKNEDTLFESPLKKLFINKNLCVKIRLPLSNNLSI